MPPRLTYTTAIVLVSIARGLRHGFDIIEAMGVPSGTVYPILRRLEDTGLVRSRWENEARAHADGRPPRRIYTLTAAGSAELARARDRFPGIDRLLDPCDDRDPLPHPAR
jgi:PadR family transcriptional regulator, regulatory protein PadR